MTLSIRTALIALFGLLSTIPFLVQQLAQLFLGRFLHSVVSNKVSDYLLIGGIIALALAFLSWRSDVYRSRQLR